MPAYALTLALTITAPLIAPGYLLLRDAVSTPRSYLTDAALGLSGAAPRALPQDFAMAVASRLVDGGVVVKALLIAGLWLAGWGAARLAATVLPDAGLPGQFVAVTIAIWNPYVAERLLQGHWSLLVGYGCLPWVAAAMLRLRTGERSGPVWSLMFWLAVAGLTPTGLILAAIVALTCGFTPGSGWPRWRCWTAALGASTLVALPWLLAPALTGSLASSQADGVSAFAARAEPGLGTVGSLAALGGIWNGEAVPASRTTGFAIAGAVVLLAVVAVGLPVLLRRAAAVPLLVLAVAAVAVPAVLATGPGLTALEATVRALPGLGVFRDAQKWVALAVPGYTLAGAAAVVSLRARIPASATSAVAATLCCAALLVTLPDLAWGVGGKMTTVHYPPGWPAVTAVVNAEPGPVAVLPPDIMRNFDWAGDAPVLDPLPRWVRADVLTTGDLIIGGQTVPGEGARAREVQELLLSGADTETLRRAGVGWVVVESGGAAFDLPLVYRDDEMALYRIGGQYPTADHRALMVAAHLVWLGVLLVGAAGLAATRLRPGR